MKKNIFYLFAIILILLIYSITIHAALVHRVSPGENLYNIALRYGITVREIIAKNNLHDPGNIYSEQILIIPNRENSWSYRVQEGDTLYLIAKKLGISMERLAKTNGIAKTDELFTRQLLYIPPKQRTYKVKAGDTLHEISQKYAISIEQIINANNNVNQNNLTVGQTLIIPYPKYSKPIYSGPNFKKLFPETFYLNGIVRGNKIALTFDDGPDNKYTPQILDVLESFNVPATFFIIGDRVNNNPDVVKRMVRDGHTIANHTWSHANLTKINEERFVKEVSETETILAKTTGLNTALLRPPYGAASIEVMNRLKNMNYKVIHWSVDSLDWIDMDFNKILINTLPAVRNNSILLFHSAGGKNHDLSATVAVLPDVIKTLRMNDYTFVKLEDLLKINAYK